MGFGRPESLRAARECPTLRAATEHILREEAGSSISGGSSSISHSRRTNMATMMKSSSELPLRHVQRPQPQPQVRSPSSSWQQGGTTHTGGGTRSPPEAQQQQQSNSRRMGPAASSFQTTQGGPTVEAARMVTFSGRLAKLSRASGLFGARSVEEAGLLFQLRPMFPRLALRVIGAISWFQCLVLIPKRP
jgi:hypothetical protein